MLEPTDRSMPPDTITNVMPIAHNPTITVCVATVFKLYADKNCPGSNAATSPSARPSARNGPSTESARLSDTRRLAHQLSFGPLDPRSRTSQPPAMHDRDRVAHSE